MFDRESRIYNPTESAELGDVQAGDLDTKTSDSVQNDTAPISDDSTPNEIELKINIPARTLLRSYLTIDDNRPSHGEMGQLDPFRIREGAELEQAREAESRKSKDDSDGRKKKKPSKIALEGSRPEISPQQ